jgi:archaemetzincin
LRNEHYGLAADENLLLSRLIKEVIHELGHTFGLIHCHAPDCVMRSSTYVEDIDQKGQSLCMSCKSLVKNQ